MNQWAAIGEKQDEKRYGQLWELSGQGEQRYFEVSIFFKEIVVREVQSLRCQT